MKVSDRPKDGAPTAKAIAPAGRLSATDAIFFNPLISSGKLYYLFVGTLASIVGFAVYAYYTQFQNGLIVTGLREPVFWGLYLSNFVFFIGISHAGTLISAILRLSHAEWRRPVTRMAESITVMAIMVGALFPLIDLGRPDRILNVFLLGRIQSPILWDFISIATYLTGSITYLYLPLIPDIAEMRDKLTNVSRVRRWIYKKLALGWTGSAVQKKRLERAISVMAIIIVPVAVSVHTVVSWAFAMNVRVGWHTAIFGPWFVGGAIYSGIAVLIIAMAVFRRSFHLQEYLTVRHFKYLGYLLITLNVAMIYFTINEHLVAFYGGEVEEMHWLTLLWNGQFSSAFYLFLGLGLIAPTVIVAIPRTRTINGIVFASVLVAIGMWLERFLIVIPTLSTPIMPYPEGLYTPTWVEWAITAGAFAGFMLAYAIFAKFFPILSRWEISEGAEESHSEH